MAEHEFDSNQNEVFTGLAGAMVFVATIFIIAGSLVAVSGLLSLSHPVSSVITIAEGVLIGLMGIWTIAASGGFREVARTEGNDITHLMSAVRKLRLVFLLMSWFVAAIIALGIITMIYEVVVLKHDI